MVAIEQITELGLGLKADLIYIDASHDYELVKKDLNAWIERLEKDGVFCGDDWNWGGVRQAVIEFSEQRGFPITSIDNFWVLETQSNRPMPISPH